jgi:hypothetical protein
VVALSILVYVLVMYLLTGNLSAMSSNASRIEIELFLPTDIIHLSLPRIANEQVYELRHIVGVNVIAHLFTFIAEHVVRASFQIAPNEVTEKTLELDSRVVRSREAASAQAAGRHQEIPSVFLHHYIGSHFGGAENRVHRVVDRESLFNAVRVFGIRILFTVDSTRLWRRQRQTEAMFKFNT